MGAASQLEQWADISPILHSNCHPDLWGPIADTRLVQDNVARVRCLRRSSPPPLLRGRPRMHESMAMNLIQTPLWTSRIEETLDQADRNQTLQLSVSWHPIS